MMLDAALNKVKPLFNDRNRKKTYTVLVIILAILLLIIVLAARSCGPAVFEVTGLSIEPERVFPGETIDIKARVTNSGKSAGEYPAELKIDGATAGSKTVSVEKNGYEEITFTVVANELGTHTVTLGSTSGTFDVITEIREWVITDEEATRLVKQKVPIGFSIHFMPGNSIEYSGMGSEGTVSFGIVDGQLSTTPADYIVYNYLTGIHEWVKYDSNAVYLEQFWFDPAEVIAPDVTSMPRLISIATEEGRAVITYEWPS